MLGIIIFIGVWAVFAAVVLKTKFTAISVAVSIIPLALAAMALSADFALNYAASINALSFNGFVLYGPLTYLLFPNQAWSPSALLTAYQAAVNTAFLLLIVVIFISVYTKYQWAYQKG